MLRNKSETAFLKNVRKYLKLNYTHKLILQMLEKLLLTN